MSDYQIYLVRKAFPNDSILTTLDLQMAKIMSTSDVGTYNTVNVFRLWTMLQIESRCLELMEQN
jgi:hypothetical protein